MTVREDILAGKYVPIMPFKDAPVTIGDWKIAQIVRRDVYPPNYNPFAEDEPGKPKIARIKPINEWYLDIITTDRGIVRQQITIKDRQEGEQLLSSEIKRIHETLHNELMNALSVKINNAEAIFSHAMTKQFNGLVAVVDTWSEITALIA